MANRTIIYDNTNEIDSIEISPNYSDENGSQGVELILDLKGNKKFRKIYLKREDAQKLLKTFIDILG